MSKFIDLTGAKFNNLTVVERAENNKSGSARWKCQCACGNYVIVRASDLKKGHSTSCGCSRKMKPAHNFVDILGQKFGRLTTIEKKKLPKSSEAYWLCKCDCGNEIITNSKSLRNGYTKSCGCLRKEMQTIHNSSETRLYRLWIGIKSRCENPNNCNYHNYGARGIKNNFESFEVFEQWALQNGYNNNLTIERKDVNGNYSPENCTFATLKEQANNRRDSVMIFHNGKTQTLKQWADELGINYNTIYARVRVYGWSIEKAFTK